MKKAVAVFVTGMFAAQSLFAAVEVSSSAAVAVDTATASAAPSGDTRRLDTAIADLNYKIELIQGRYLKLDRDIDGLRQADRDEKRYVDQHLLSLPDPRRLENLETESALLRSELSQVREEMSVLKKGPEDEEKPAHAPELWQQVLHSPWLAVASLGISFIALVKR